MYPPTCTLQPFSYYEIFVCVSLFLHCICHCLIVCPNFVHLTSMRTMMSQLLYVSSFSSSFALPHAWSVRKFHVPIVVYISRIPYLQNCLLYITCKPAICEVTLTHRWLMRPLKIHPAHVHAPECARWVTTEPCLFRCSFVRVNIKG